MTAIVCQFLWSGIAPSSEDKSQSIGPRYMLKVSCDRVIYNTFTCTVINYAFVVFYGMFLPIKFSWEGWHVSQDASKLLLRGTVHG